MAKNKLVYKVRDKFTGLFSEGGYSGLHGNPQPNGWSERGKVWTGTGAVKNHFNQFRYIPRNWEVVSFELIEEQKNVFDANEFAGTKVKLEKEAEEKRLREEAKQKSDAIKAAAIAKLSQEEMEVLGIKNMKNKPFPDSWPAMDFTQNSLMDDVLKLYKRD